ncbi:hypothetical protein CVS30_08955 [Arthrobacter psychrolactophilus]|uniref:Uncharacterized protein n=1 Tax=Arthrobacter psychrolactophilus TaxID=92442 RepID=A0A2V5JLI8_9MICC|nr:hypothetical protein [Arthrobacter psychrolactophilus]PYI38676.1 hypothetical protein CVS30_08955 [Arthrobacter psychrolactophilus]
MQSHSSSLEKYSWRPKVAFALGSQELKEQLFSADRLEELLTFADVLNNQVLTEFDSERFVGHRHIVDLMRLASLDASAQHGAGAADA